MQVINVRNVNDALQKGVGLLSLIGEREPSRNGTVLVAPEPVATVYARPRERVLFSALRDANPFFHLMEALWMLAGRNDVESMAYYAASMRDFSDDGETLNGAYGYRWRQHFGYDQLAWVVDELKHNPNSRRVVLSMWDPGQPEQEGTGDFYKATHGSKDVPCNTHIYFRVRSTGSRQVLDMTVCCRSNDIVWGAYGANAVHMSVLQEYVAAASGYSVGEYTQLSNNYHAYIEREDTKRLFDKFAPSIQAYNPYVADVRPTPLIGDDPLTGEEFLSNVEAFVRDPLGKLEDFRSSFLCTVAVPMATVYRAHKQGDTLAAVEALGSEQQRDDWCAAGREWLLRRHQRQLATKETR